MTDLLVSLIASEVPTVGEKTVHIISGPKMCTVVG